MRKKGRLKQKEKGFYGIVERGKMQSSGRAKEKREIERVRKKKRRDIGHKVRNEEQ